MAYEVICGADTASCVCVIALERCDGRHLCDCGGSWRNDANREEDLLILPVSLTLGWAETVGESERMIAEIARQADGND